MKKNPILPPVFPRYIPAPPALSRANLAWVLIVSVFTGLSSVQSQTPTPSPSPSKYHLDLTTDRANARYHVGETVVFNAELKVDDMANQEVKLPYAIRENQSVIVAKGELTFTHGKASLPAEFKKPSFLTLIVTLPDGDPTKKQVYAGAACDPEKLLPSMPKPDDFDAFWNGKKAQLDAMPFQVELKPIPAMTDDQIETYELILDNINNTKIYGYFAKPKGNGPFPAYMQVHAAGVYSMNANGVVSMARQGAMAITINPHEMENGKPPEFYAALKQGPLNDYSHIGNNDRETCYFLRMFCSCYRAAQYITSRPEWDGKRFVVSGTSQGGGQAFVTAYLCPKVSAFVACVPALCDQTAREADRDAGWPHLVSYKDGKADPKQLETARYFDCVNFAYGIKAKAIVGVGFIDTTCAPCSVYTAFNVLSSPKQIIDMPLNGHTSGPCDFYKSYANAFIHEELGLKP